MKSFIEEPIFSSRKTIVGIFSLLLLVACLMLVGSQSASAREGIHCGTSNDTNSAECSHGGDRVPWYLVKQYEGLNKTYIQKAKADPMIPQTQKNELANINRNEKSKTEASCAGSAGTGGARVQIIYLRKPHQPKMKYETKTYLREVASGMDAIYINSARKTGGKIRVRWAREANCKVSVKEVVAAKTAKIRTFTGAKKAIKQSGRKSNDRKYLAFVATNNVDWDKVNGGICGQATLRSGKLFHDGPAQNNMNNTRVGFAIVWNGNDRSCWTSWVGTHELNHNLGAVQSTAPHSTLAGHCTDGYDVMCYDDGGVNSGDYNISSCSHYTSLYLLDCGNNDYFHSDPVGHNTYLSTRWNIADSRFLIKRMLTN